MADVLRAHWGATPSPPVFAGGDMFVWNALLRASPSSPHPQRSRVRPRLTRPRLARAAQRMSPRLARAAQRMSAACTPASPSARSRCPCGACLRSRTESLLDDTTACADPATARPALTPLPDPTYRPRCSPPPLPRRNAHAATPGSTRRADSTGSRTRCRYRGRRSPRRDIDAATRPAAHRSRRPNAPRSWLRRPGLTRPG